MNQYEINLKYGGVKMVYGEIAQFTETGQTLIYSTNDPTYTNIAAVIPADALIVVTKLTPKTDKQ